MNAIFLAASLPFGIGCVRQQFCSEDRAVDKSLECLLAISPDCKSERSVLISELFGNFPIFVPMSHAACPAAEDTPSSSAKKAERAWNPLRSWLRPNQPGNRCKRGCGSSDARLCKGPPDHQGHARNAEPQGSTTECCK